MGLFGKKDKDKKESAPALAELPKLPELPGSNYPKFSEFQKNQLPSIPSNSFGKKFSQDSIKEAVSGKRGDEEAFYADDFSDTEKMMQESLRHPLTEEMDEDAEMENERAPMEKSSGKDYRRTMEAEPIFVRIDKFEEGLKIFSEAKSKISEIEHTLAEIKRVREKEEQELQMWHENLKSMKSSVEKVDRDIFSKI